jgi:subtilisin family serine protease
MKIRFRKDTNIRSDHQNPGNSPLGKVYANTVIEVEYVPYEGATLQGDNRWWRDKNGWYYWAGETERLIETPSPVRPDKIPPPLPQPPAAELPARPPVPAAQPVALPSPDEPPHESVPEGEWRLPEIPDLEDDDTDPTPAVLTPPEKKTLAPPPPSLRTTSPPPASPLNNPRAQRLNWGLETARIPAQWWQEQKLGGQGVRLAILSTGVAAQHPDLSGLHPENLMDFTGNNDPNDAHGLGTQAAIVAAGRGAIAFGVAPELELLSGKIGAAPNEIRVEYLIEGLEWAIRRQADVVAMLTDFITLTDAQKQALSDVIARALDVGIILLAPVGNSSERKPEDRYPAALEGVISVGAHHAFNRRSDFSARSYHLDFLAPGEGLHTSNLQHDQVVNSKDTAVATAFAAGFVALVKQWEKQQGLVSMPGDLTALLHETAHYEGINKGKDTELGFGLLNPPAVLARLIKN